LFFSKSAKALLERLAKAYRTITGQAANRQSINQGEEKGSIMKGVRTFTAILVCLISLLALATTYGQTRPRPTPGAAAADFKVRYKVTFMSMGGPGQGQTSESLTMIKGPRERSETRMGQGYDTINITQCDLKRTIQISDTTKKYIITPMAVSSSATTPAAPTTPQSAAPVRKGGTVTYITSSIDTGERREMFGFTARHVKSSMTIKSSPDACNPIDHRTETDGWYIDLNVGFDCNLDGRPPVMPGVMRPGGCVDQPIFKREGSGRIGYPLIETTKMYGPGGQVTFSTAKEVIELSREPLDIALFDVPAGYSEATSQQELFAIPSMTDVISGRQPGNSETTASPSAAPDAKKPGTLRVGVVQINNKAGKQISQEALRQRLIGQIQSAGIEAVALNGMSAPEIEAEAKAKQCDYVLYSDVTALKSSKIGGMFGRVTGVDSVAKTEAKVEFKLFAVGETSPRLQSSASAKVEGDEASAGTAIDAEAKAVIAEVRKR
jgi:hypothetical protein